MNAKEMAREILEMAEMTCESPEKIWAENVDAKAKAGLNYEEVAEEIAKARAGRG